MPPGCPQRHRQLEQCHCIRITVSNKSKREVNLNGGKKELLGPSGILFNIDSRRVPEDTSMFYFGV